MLDLINESDFKERFEELKEEYARKHGFFGEDDEYASTWWENDKDLYAAEEYAYGVISKEMFEFSFNDYAKTLVDKMQRIHNSENERLGSFEGTMVCFPFVKTIEDAAAWYLLTYDTDALQTLHEQAADWKEGYDNNSCFGFKFRDVRNFIVEKCTADNLNLEPKFTQAKDLKPGMITETGTISKVERVWSWGKEVVRCYYNWNGRFERDDFPLDKAVPIFDTDNANMGSNSVKKVFNKEDAKASLDSQIKQASAGRAQSIGSTSVKKEDMER